MLAQSLRGEEPLGCAAMRECGFSSNLNHRTVAPSDGVTPEVTFLPQTEAVRWSHSPTRRFSLPHEKKVPPFPPGRLVVMSWSGQPQSSVSAAVTAALINQTAGSGYNLEDTRTTFKRIIHGRALHRGTIAVLFV